MAAPIDKTHVKREANRKRAQLRRDRRADGVTVFHLPLPAPLVRDGLIAGRWLPRKDAEDKKKVLVALLRFTTAAMTKYLNGVTRDANILHRDAEFGEMLRTESRQKETPQC